MYGLYIFLLKVFCSSSSEHHPFIDNNIYLFSNLCFKQVLFYFQFFWIFFVPLLLIYTQTNKQTSIVIIIIMITDVWSLVSCVCFCLLLIEVRAYFFLLVRFFFLFVFMVVTKIKNEKLYLSFLSFVCFYLF